MPASDPSATTPGTFPPACEPASLFDVRGIVVVITGGGTGMCPLALKRPEFLILAILSASGIGLMMATALEHSGATVYIIGRRLSVLEAAAKEHSVSTTS